MAASLLVCIHVMHGIVQAAYPGYTSPQDSARENIDRDLETDCQEQGPLGLMKAHLKRHGGWRIMSFLLLRLAGCAFLCLLSCLSLVRNMGNHEELPSRSLLHDPETWMAATYVGLRPLRCSYILIITLKSSTRLLWLSELCGPILGPLLPHRRTRPFYSSFLASTFIGISGHLRLTRNLPRTTLTIGYSGSNLRL